MSSAKQANWNLGCSLLLIEYSSELILEKKDSQKIKLSGRDVWSEKFSGLYFEVKENKIIQLGNSGNDDTELPNNQKDIKLVEDGIVVSYLGKKILM